MILVPSIHYRMKVICVLVTQAHTSGSSCHLQGTRLRWGAAPTDPPPMLKSDIVLKVGVIEIGGRDCTLGSKISCLFIG